MAKEQTEALSAKQKMASESSASEIRNVQACGYDAKTILLAGATKTEWDTQPNGRSVSGAQNESAGSSTQKRRAPGSSNISSAHCAPANHDRILDFLTTLRLGLDWIHEAGKKLVAILKDNPSAMDDIIMRAKSPCMTLEVLKTIEAVGRGEIAAEVLILPVHVFRRIMLLPVEEQIRAVSGVAVFTPPRNGKGDATVIIKPAASLNPTESYRVIGNGKLRTPKEQSDMIGHNGVTVGVYQVIIESGQEPTLKRTIRSSIPGYEKQIIKLTKGCALVELREERT